MAAWRDIDKELCKRLSKKSKKGISVQYGYGTVLYSTEQYCIVRNSTVQYGTVLYSTCCQRDFGRRSKMSDRVAGKDMTHQDLMNCSCAELFCSKAHLLESEVTHWALATSLEREGSD